MDSELPSSRPRDDDVDAEADHDRKRHRVERAIEGAGTDAQATKESTDLTRHGDAEEWLALFPSMMDVAHDAMVVLSRRNFEFITFNTNFKNLLLSLGQDDIAVGTQIMKYQVQAVVTKV